MPCRWWRQGAIAANDPAMRLTNTSRTSSRGRQAASTKPSGNTVTMSLAECTARSIAPSSSACSISLVNRPLPPTSASGRSWIASPVVRMTSDLDRVLADAMRRRQQPAHHMRLRQRQRAAARADTQPDRGLRHETSQCYAARSVLRQNLISSYRDSGRYNAINS